MLSYADPRAPLSLSERIGLGIVASLAVLSLALSDPIETASTPQETEEAPQSVSAPSSLPPSTLGGSEIPRGLSCSEDEALYWLAPDVLGCVHIERIAPSVSAP